MARNLFSPREFEACKTLLDQRVYTSRLLGADPDLVLHGGGNTSAKGTVTNLWGEEEKALFIKGSGWDLATIEPAGFAAVRLDPLLKMRSLSKLSDPDMVNALRVNMTDYTMPTPSVETLLHAFIPDTFVDHTHADAIIALTNQPNGEDLIRRVFENRVAIVPYIMPGFALSKLCADIYEKHPGVEGLVLISHGIFSFGETAQQSYERMIALVSRAEEYIEKNKKPAISPMTASIRSSVITDPTCSIVIPAPAYARAGSGGIHTDCAIGVDPRLRGDDKGGGDDKGMKISPKLNPATCLSTIYSILAKNGFASTLKLTSSPEVLDFLSREDAKSLTQIGPLTPDHIIRTKQFPLFVECASEAQLSEAFTTALRDYTSAYKTYFDTHASPADQPLTMLDPFPRVILIPGLGIITVGKTQKEACISRDIYLHTIKVILDAQAVGTYTALRDKDLFDVEYWILEQAKLKQSKTSNPLAGKTVVVTGGSSGIGAALCKTYAAQGSQVFNLDLNPSQEKGVTYIKTDVSDATAMSSAFETLVCQSGKVDITILNAGIFPASWEIKDMDLEMWKKSEAINLDGALFTAKSALQWMCKNPCGGDLIFIASKNVSAPGKKAGAYSVMKAAQTQLARICALEAGQYGIRVNTVHPNMIFDTGIWTDDVIKQRGAAYGMSPEEYRTNNVLRAQLSTQDVATAVLRLTDGSFSKTTGAQIPIDGGTERVI